MKPLAPRNPDLPCSAGEMRLPSLRTCSTWRDRLRHTLWPVWPKLQQLPPEKRAYYLRELYPFDPPWKGGPSWQYKVWRDEIARLEGRKPPLGAVDHAARERELHADTRQGKLFPEGEGADEVRGARAAGNP